MTETLFYLQQNDCDISRPTTIPSTIAVTQTRLWMIV